MQDSIVSGTPTQMPEPIRFAPIASPQQVQQYVREGYLVLPDLLTPSEVRELKRETLAIARGQRDNSLIALLPDDVSDDEALGRILCLHYPACISPVIHHYVVGHPGVCGVLSQLVGAHLPFWDGSVKTVESTLFVKPPGFQGQAWHQDEVYLHTRDRSMTGAWIAIDDADTRNGCLSVIPGSHRSGYLWPQREHNAGDEWDEARESFGFDAEAKTAVQMEAGSVIFFNGYLLHGSFRNRSHNYRRSLVSHYMNAYSLMPYRFSRHADSNPSDDRKVELVTGVDPYAWKGIEDQGAEVFLRTCKANADTAGVASGQSGAAAGS
jgi:Phytanoyl-CoA dioxygenase (PhyH)